MWLMHPLAATAVIEALVWSSVAFYWNSSADSTDGDGGVFFCVSYITDLCISINLTCLFAIHLICQLWLSCLILYTLPGPLTSKLLHHKWSVQSWLAVRSCGVESPHLFMQLKPRAYSKKLPQRLGHYSSSNKSAVKGRLFSTRTAHNTINS